LLTIDRFRSHSPRKLPDDDNLPKIKAFCRNILEIYLDAVKDEYPEVDRELLERDIIIKLPFVYGVNENRMLKEAGMMLRALATSAVVHSYSLLDPL